MELNTEFEIGALQSPSPILNTSCNLLLLLLLLLKCKQAAVDPYNDQILCFEVLY